MWQRKFCYTIFMELVASAPFDLGMVKQVKEARIVKMEIYTNEIEEK